MSFNIRDYSLSLNGKPLISNLTFSLSAGEIMAVTGASGSGKSTLLADISGVCPPAFQSSGEFILNGENIQTKPIHKRHIGILFQDDLLFPHLNVFENLAFGLPTELTFSEKNKRILNALEGAELTGYAQRDIATLSGGQKARISLLRAMLSEPKMLLLDEPFSKLDKQLRSSFRSMVFQQIKERAIPAILVTHDHEDIPSSISSIQLDNFSIPKERVSREGNHA